MKRQINLSHGNANAPVLDQRNGQANQSAGNVRSAEQKQTNASGS